MRRHFTPRVILWLLCLAVVLFLTAPVLIVIPLALSTSEFLEFPPPSYSLDWFRLFFGDQAWLTAAYLSLRVALGATLIALLAGTAASYALVRGRFRLRGLTEALLMFPIAMPIVVYAVGAYIVALRIDRIGSTPILILAHAVLSLPFVIITVSAGLRTLDYRLELAAQSLGASPLRAFMTFLPLIAPAVWAGALLAFAFSADEVVVALFISSGTDPTFPVRIFSSIQYQLNPLVPVASTFVLGASFTTGFTYLLVRSVGARQRRINRLKPEIEDG